MFDISGMKLNLLPEIINLQWEKIEADYKKIESDIPQFNEIKNQYFLKCHNISGFLLSEQAYCPLAQLLRNRNYSIVIDGVMHSRGREYYPGIFLKTDNITILRTILQNTKDLTAAYMQSISGLWRTSEEGYRCAYLDYVRNYLLIMLYVNNTIIRYIDPSFSDCSRYFKKILLEVDHLLYVALTENYLSYFSLHEQLITYFTKFIDQVESSNCLDTINVRSNLIRESREIDSLIHIFKFAELISKNYLSAKTIIIGLEYGGIELPFAVNVVRLHTGKSLQPIGLAHLSQYSEGVKYNNPTLEDIFFNETKKDFLESDHILLLDDSVTTARSLDIFNKFASKYKKPLSAGVVAFKASHRYHHLVMERHGGVNPTALRFIPVLCQANYARTHKTGSYTNSSGVFDLNKHQLHEAFGL